MQNPLPTGGSGFRGVKLQIKTDRQKRGIASEHWCSETIPIFWFCEERNSVLFLFSDFLAAFLHCFALLAIFASLDFFATLLLGFVANLLTFFSLSFFAARFLHGFLCSYVEGENTHAQKEHKLFHDVSVFSVMECVSYRKVEAPLYLV